MEYQHGGDIYSQKVELDYSANLNPLGLPEGVKEAVRKAADTCACYPDSQCRRLVQALSLHHAIDGEHIICGNGAADLIFNLTLALKPKEAAVLAPGFLEYEQALRSIGCHVRPFLLKEEEGFEFHEEDFCRFLEAEGQRLSMAFLCNPNNPTGLTISAQEVEDVLKLCRKKEIFLVMDECFCDFLGEPERVSAIPFLKTYPNLLILKAFTKTYAMAGLRLGYGLCQNSGVLERIKEIRQPWSVSSVAQAAGEAALRERAYVEDAKSLIAEEREFLKEGLASLGFTVWDSQANYLFFKDPRKVPEKELYFRLKEQGILIRSCANYTGLSDAYYRICVRKREENERLLKAVGRCL